MLNPKTNERELAYIVNIDEIRPIEGYDRVEYARVGGWWVIVKKDQFKVDDPAIYIEVDSKVPEVEPFMFLEKRKFRVKTLKMCGVISQGLLMHPNDFGWEALFDEYVGRWEIVDSTGSSLEVGDFVSNMLQIVYYEPEDNKRKGKGPDKYAKMAQRRPDIFKKKWARWMMRREWGKKLMFKLFGKKKDKRSWPAWVTKTDEERCQNMPFLFPGDDTIWLATEKIDGSSTTFTIKKKKGNKYEFYVCSRNVMFDTPEKAENCYYDTNIYLEMAKKYNIEETMARMLKVHDKVDFITIQGETYGESVQKRDYGLKGRDFMAFNLIFGYETKNGYEKNRCDSYEMKQILDAYEIPTVPILDEITLPETCEKLLEYAASEPSKVDGGMREGVVLRTLDGQRSFKAVSNEFLLKYHS